jgi:large repetitive protein
MHRWRYLLPLPLLACSLAFPAASFGATPTTVTGPPTIGEAAGPATFTIDCGTADPVIGVDPQVPFSGQLTVTVTPGSPAATQGADYGDPSRATVECVAGNPSGTVEVPITDDALDEPGEKFTVTIEGTLVPTVPAAEISRTVNTSFTTTIGDNDVPEATIAPLAFVVEGTPTVELVVTLSQTPVEPATVTYATEDSSALAGSDYTTTSGQLTIPAGQTTGTISVPILDDATPEPAEAFYVNLSAPVNATLTDTKKQAAVGIFDGDKPPVPVASMPESVTVKEGDAGTVNVLFPITLSVAPSERVQLDWRAGNYTAGLADYESAKGTVTFEPGQTTKTVSVNVKGDTRDEPAEAFVVLLGNPRGATIAAPGASFGVITDDDGPKVGIGRPVPRGKSLILVLSCPKLSDLCKGRLDASIGKVRVGRKAFELQKDSGREIRLKLSRKARALLAKRARRVRFTATAADSTGATRAVSRRFRVKRLR